MRDRYGIAELESDVADLRVERARLLDERTATLGRPRRAVVVDAIKLSAAIAFIDDAIGRAELLLSRQHRAKVNRGDHP